MDYLHLFKTEAEYNTARNNEYTEPWVSATNIGGSVNPSYRVNFNKTEYEKLLETPLTFEVTSDGTIYWKSYNSAYTSTIEYSKNNGNWVSITSASGDSAPIINVINGDTVQFRGNNAAYADASNSRYVSFSDTTCGFNLKGNIMSLINSTDFTNLTTLESAYTFVWLFKECTGLTDVSKLVLPAINLKPYCYYGMFGYCTSLTTVPKLPVTTLTDYCYSYMFYNCTSLTTAPELPATTLADYCYENMFYGCTSLVQAPELPATTLTNHCYYSMFYNCSGITSLPELPATTLAPFCYSRMFQGCKSITNVPNDYLPVTALTECCYGAMFQLCTNLTTVPELPATIMAQSCYANMFARCTKLTEIPRNYLPSTTLANLCYQNMFQTCTRLTTAPELPATDLIYRCYEGMFGGCSSLNYIKALFTTTPGTNYTRNWVSGVASTGTFVKNSAATWTTTGVNGIPNNWTVQDA